MDGAPAVRSTWADRAAFELHAFVAPVAVTVAEVAAPVVESAVIARPRAQGDPPDALFARYCSLLL